MPGQSPKNLTSSRPWRVALGTDAGVVSFLGGLSPQARAIVVALREVIKGEAPRVREFLLWSDLLYHRPDIGDRVKGAVCQIAVKAGRVRLEVIHSVRLVDPHGLFQGNRVSKRHVWINNTAAGVVVGEVGQK